MSQIFGKIVNGEYHEADLSGWVPVVKPEHNPQHQRLTGPVLSEDGTQYVYTVSDVPVDDIAPGIETQIKAIRQGALDQIVNSAGVGMAYDTNIKAANTVVSNSGSNLMWAGMTAEKYAADMGAKMGMSAADWSNWVLAENTREKTRGMLIEQQYIAFKVAITKCKSPEVMVTYPALFKNRVALLMGTSDFSSVKLDPVPLK